MNTKEELDNFEKNINRLSRMDFLLGGMAAVGAGFFTNPLEVLKTRMQLQGELQARGKHVVHFRNMFHASIVIAKTEGILALQNGLVPALWTQLFLNGVRFGTYGLADSNGFIKNEEGNIILYKSVITGALGGAGGAVACSPLFLVKTHFQSQAAKSIAVGYQHNHEGSWKALKNIYNQYGIKGLWRGVATTVPRAAVGSTAQLTSFAYCKQWMHEYNLFIDSPLLTSFWASMVGGVFISLAMTPFDLIAVRIYNQGVDAHGKGLLYSGILDCVVKIMRTEGFMGFYKGLFPNYVRLGPHTVLCLVFWDELKALLNKYWSDN